MARCFAESQRAYTSGDGASAKALSNEGKEHKAKMEQLHGEASAWIYASEPRRSFHEWSSDVDAFLTLVWLLENNEVTLYRLYAVA